MVTMTQTSPEIDVVFYLYFLLSKIAFGIQDLLNLRNGYLVDNALVLLVNLTITERDCESESEIDSEDNDEDEDEDSSDSD